MSYILKLKNNTLETNSLSLIGHKTVIFNNYIKYILKYMCFIYIKYI